MAEYDDDVGTDDQFAASVVTLMAEGKRMNSKAMAGRRAAAIALHRAWLLSEPVALGPLAGDTHGGVLRFENGGVVSVGTFAQNLAAAIAMQSDAPTLSAPPTRDEIRGALGGKRVCCWCRENEPCHGDTLCEVANA